MTLEWFITETTLFFVLLFFSSVFSSTEVAYTGLTVSQMSRVKRIKARALQYWEKSPDLVLAVLLLSNNAVNIGVGVISAGIAIGLSLHLDIPSAPTSTAIGILSGTILLIVGEIIPKIFAKHYPVTWALRMSPFMNTWIMFSKPIAKTAVWVTHNMVLGTEHKSKRSTLLKESDLREVLTHAAIPSASRRILHNLLEFSQTHVRDIMTDRSQIQSVSIKDPIQKIVAQAIKSGFSRIPIYSGTIDNMTGVLYTKDLLVAWRSGGLIVLEDLIRPIHHVKDNLPISELMRTFRSGRHHLAVVEDSATNKVKGLVTLEDALEMIVGEIEEE